MRKLYDITSIVWNLQVLFVANAAQLQLLYDYDGQLFTLKFLI